MIDATLAVIVLAFISVSVLHGLWNTIDHLAWKVHVFAVSMRSMQDRRTKEVTERWVRTLEG